MRLLTIRRGFLADHSSTSYEFLAVDKPLDSKARAAVSRLSSRARPSGRRVRFVYNVEGYDIPGGWEALMAKYYDVMYSESYDWWTLAIAFNTTDKVIVDKLRKYEFRGVDDLGVDIGYKNKRAVVTIHCRMDGEQLQYESDDYDEDDYDEDDYDEDDYDEDDYDEDSSDIASGDPILNLLVRVRDRLRKGDCQPLYAVWEMYADEEEEDEVEKPPKPRKSKVGAAVAASLANKLTTS